MHAPVKYLYYNLYLLFQHSRYNRQFAHQFLALFVALPGVWVLIVLKGWYFKNEIIFPSVLAIIYVVSFMILNQKLNAQNWHSKILEENNFSPGKSRPAYFVLAVLTLILTAGTIAVPYLVNLVLNT